MAHPSLPARQGLYDPANEHDACGVGFIANIKGAKSHGIIEQGLQILKNLTHRGAVGADPLAGDGAGILIQIPDQFFREEMAGRGVKLPPPGEYGVGMVFLPQEPASRLACEYEIERAIKDEGQVLLGWRDVPRDNAGLGESVKKIEPVIRQVFIGRGAGVTVTDALERKLYIIRKVSGHAIQALKLEHSKEFYVPSMSARTLVYKGMLLAGQVGTYYKDLSDPRATSALALVHQRFSTNTFPTWDLAHPFRMIAHNGEINTLRGNVNWLRARQGAIFSPILGKDLDKVWPLIYDGQSDSASFDNALELLTMSGYSLAHAMMMLIPEAWEKHTLMDPHRRAFYEYHAAMMEPWDGPAAVAFSDGRQIGATLDRNGLRPARYLVTSDDMVVMASETGVLPIAEEKIIKKWRLQPGKMFLIDLEAGRIIDDKELKDTLANAKPYGEWIERIRIKLDDLPASTKTVEQSKVPLLDRQQAFGYTQEDLKFILRPMAQHGEEAIGSMGNDLPLAVLSHKNKTLYHYFKQLFAQVTNPPIDPIREELVTSLVSFIGPKPNLLGIDEIEPADAPRGQPAGAGLQRDGDDPAHRLLHRRQVQVLRDRHHLPGRLGQGGDRGKAGKPLRAGRGCGSLRLQHPDRVGSQTGRDACRNPGAAGSVRDSPAPGGQGLAHLRRPGGGDRVGARGASLRAARGLRRRGGAPLPGDGDHPPCGRIDPGRLPRREGSR